MDPAIAQLADEAISRGFMPGLAVAVAGRDGTQVGHFGVRSVHDAQPVTAGTRFRLGSISKLVTAAIVLKLAEEGRLDIASPVATLVPGDDAIASLPAAVTVETLLNHTSGLPDFTRAELEAAVERGVSTDEGLREVLRRSPEASPGARWQYADAPYRVLTRLVEHVSGLSFGAYLSERLAPALGTPSLALCVPGAADHANGYLSEAGLFRPEPAYAIEGLLGEGGLCATVEDLARIPIALAEGNWLSAESLQRMTSPTRLTDGALVDYGLGVRGGLLGEYSAWGHTGGGLHGSWAAVAYYPDRGVSVAVVANGTGNEVDAGTLQARIAALVLDVGPPSVTPLPLERVDTFSGAYQRAGLTTCLTAISGDLVRTRLGSPAPPTNLYSQSEYSFARLDYPLDRFVFQIEGRTAVAYNVYYDGFFAEHWRRAPDAVCAPPQQP